MVFCYNANINNKGLNMIIEKNKPSPVSPTKVLKSMEVGDSIFLEGQESNSCDLYNGMRMSAYRNGKEVSARAEHGGLRIWRTK